jgi:hypothetical protein
MARITAATRVERDRNPPPSFEVGLAVVWHVSVRQDRVGQGKISYFS